MRMSDWSSDVCSSDLHGIAGDHLEIFAADPGRAHRDGRAQNGLQHDLPVPRHGEDEQQQGQRAEPARDDREDVPLSQDALAVRMTVGKFHITPPSIEGPRVEWLHARRMEEPTYEP